MALTATATSETYHCALIQLAMMDTVLVALPPDRSNTRYSVKPATTLATLTDELSSQLCDCMKVPRLFRSICLSSLHYYRSTWVS